MPLSRRQFNRALIAGLASAAWPLAHAAKTAPAKTPAAPGIVLEEGRNWSAIVPAQPGDSPGKIEVLEFFSYGCSHCNDFNPLVSRWAAKLPKDVVFHRVPITFGRAAWSNLSRLYYSLEASGDLARLDQAVFDAVHIQHKNLFTEKSAMDWLASQKVNLGKFSDIFHSFAVETRLARAEQLAKIYKVNSVPQLTVGGRYAVLGQSAKTQPELLAIADALIVKARNRG